MGDLHRGLRDRAFAPHRAGLSRAEGYDAGATQAHMTSLQTRNAARDFGFELDLWEATLTSPGITGRFLTNLFIVLRDGGVQYRHKKGHRFQWFKYPVAVAVSHGGRILIQLAPLDRAGLHAGGSQFKHAFIQWLLGKNLNQLNDMGQGGGTRAVATHNIKVTGEGNILANGRAKVLQESGGSTYRGMTHIGINLPLGGQGNISPHPHAQDNTVHVDTTSGRHGHAYVGYKAPTVGAPGGVLVGIEGSEAGRWDMLGHFHGASATSSAISMSGGVKFTKLGFSDMPSEKDCMMVDLTPGWDRLVTHTFAPAAVRAPSVPGPRGITLNLNGRTSLPRYDQWKSHTSRGRMHRRSSALRKIDDQLKNYWLSLGRSASVQNRYINLLQMLQATNGVSQRDRKPAWAALRDRIYIEMSDLRGLGAMDNNPPPKPNP